MCMYFEVVVRIKLSSLSVITSYEVETMPGLQYIIAFSINIWSTTIRSDSFQTLKS